MKSAPAKAIKVFGAIVRRPSALSGYVKEFNRRVKSFVTSTAEPVIAEAWRKTRLAASIKHIHGIRKIECAPNCVVVLCLVRNGEPYVKSFVEYHQSLGVRQIVFLDNDSTDRTIEIARRYEDVTVIRSLLPYKKYKSDMKRYLLTRFASDCWGMLVDIDELFDYPFSDRVSLSELVGYLNEHAYTTVVAHMLDMFSELALGEAGRGDEHSLYDVYRCYDISSINKTDYHGENNVASNPRIKDHMGGIRKTVFDLEWIHLTKHPLMFVGKGVRLLTSHSVSNAKVADFSAVLYHYKFLDCFERRTEQAVREGNYYNDSAEYKKYQQVLSRNPRLKMRQPSSLMLNSVQDLVEQEFLVVSDQYIRWVERNGRKQDLREIFDGGARPPSR